MRKRTMILAATMLTFTIGGYAQKTSGKEVKSQAPVASTTPAAKTTPTTTSATPTQVAKPVASTTMLTEVEKLKLENVNMKFQLMQATVQQLQQQIRDQQSDLNRQKATAVADFEKGHPGYVWHDSQGPNDPEGLVKSESAPKTADKK